jgi:EAL domain-containing protein (putative c-di-GMP-specific phosphodiesterase class I)
LVLDDFGTGYSSLTHLTRYPIEAVKVDSSFVAGLGTSARETAVVSAVIALGAELGVKVVAEGVETEEQLSLLAPTGCYGVQGYLFDRPAPAPSLDLVGSR